MRSQTLTIAGAAVVAAGVLLIGMAYATSGVVHAFPAECFQTPFASTNADVVSVGILAQADSVPQCTETPTPETPTPFRKLKTHTPTPTNTETPKTNTPVPTRRATTDEHAEGRQRGRFGEAAEHGFGRQRVGRHDGVAVGAGHSRRRARRGHGLRRLTSPLGSTSARS